MRTPRTAQRPAEATQTAPATPGALGYTPDAETPQRAAEALEKAIAYAAARVEEETGTACPDWITEQITDAEWIFSGPDGEIDLEALQRAAEAVAARTAAWIAEEART